jgi:hypothetical protein
LKIGIDEYSEMVAIDENHLDFIGALIKSHKPLTLLELGYGSGRATKKIASALTYNRVKAKFDVVDNWFDTGGQQWINPEELHHFITSSLHQVSSND